MPLAARSSPQLALDGAAVEPDVLAADETVAELEDVEDPELILLPLPGMPRKDPTTVPVISWSMTTASSAK
jgi:hypothetical protein